MPEFLAFYPLFCYFFIYNTFNEFSDGSGSVSIKNTGWILPNIGSEQKKDVENLFLLDFYF